VARKTVDDDKRPVEPGLSRRSFLQGSALATAGATVLGAASVLIEQAAAAPSNGLPVVGPQPVPITLKIIVPLRHCRSSRG
jgi:hypothetical protein